MIENVSMKPATFEPIRKNHFIFEIGKIDPNLVKSATYDPMNKNIVATFHETSDSTDIVKEFLRIKDKDRKVSCSLHIIDAVGNIKRRTTFRKCSIRNIKTSGFDYSSSDFCETLVILDYETVTFSKEKGKIKTTQTVGISNSLPRPLPQGKSTTIEMEESYERTAIGLAMKKAVDGEKWQNKE